MLAESVRPEDTDCLKRDYDYSFIVCYGGFEDNEYEIIDKKSCIIDLTENIDQIFSSFTATCRNEIRRFAKIPDLVVHTEVDDFSKFYAFHQQCEAERYWHPVPMAELEASFVVYATYRGSPLSAVSCYSTGKRIRVGQIFSRRRANEFADVQRVVFSSASRKVIFEICKQAKDRGYITLDLGGVDETDPSKSGITKFKLSFGGAIVPTKIGRYMTPRFAEMLPRIRAMGLDIT